MGARKGHRLLLASVPWTHSNEGGYSGSLRGFRKGKA